MNNNYIKGLTSKRNGEHLESLIENGSSIYEEKGIATAEKTPEPMRVIKTYDKNNGQFICCFEKQAQPDFKGTLYTGQTIIFEAKHTDKDRIQESVVTETQKNNFDKYTKMNAICFVVVSFGFDTFCRIPWDVFSNMKKIYGRKYITKEEAFKYRIPFRAGSLMYLDGLEIDE